MCRISGIVSYLFWNGIYFNVIHPHLHWTQDIITKVIYQYRQMNLNYKEFLCHGAVICNYC